jgi:hypothetical protein
MTNQGTAQNNALTKEVCSIITNHLALWQATIHNDDKLLNGLKSFTVALQQT